MGVIQYSHSWVSGGRGECPLCQPVIRDGEDKPISNERSPFGRISRHGASADKLIVIDPSEIGADDATKMADRCCASR